MKTDKKVVAIIPARGGSKRIPKKNIVDFNGKPLIAWTIEAAKKSGLFEKIVVSTDSSEIAEVAKRYGAEVPFLRDTAADDHSPVSEATLRTILQLEENGEYFDEVVQLFAVCPLRDASDIKESYQFFKDKEVPFVLSCYKYVWMNPWWAVTLNEKNQPNWILKDTRKRSQDLPDLFSPTGAIWIANIEDLKRDKTFYGKDHIFWEMDWKKAVDIDNYEDLELATALKSLL
ncbi:acylneuraminate cytidylyltransferase family protein [Salegentibacter sp. F188]|uniref:Acylneuraminate cytidylyltransferase family protein n=1 Tax=Autumnicola patrickiae TaxID=3075591 RepID=A0ABU3E1G6_9FLAO|nr:acylneuraminate cytidylyltransferase family protein [Salegentibacter sp. F188]MDT0689812.1 acylneuraminate cytidylyltransferase family protein [Salegentibacter sp. F188]